MVSSEDIGKESMVSTMNTNGHTNGYSSNLTESDEQTEANPETGSSLNGNWEPARPKKRGRKPGSGAAAKLAKAEARKANPELAEDVPEVRRRKRETEVLVGEQIRRLRLESGLSQEELGRSSHMSTSYISRLETNEVNPTVDALHRIVRVFGLTIDGLLGLNTKAATILDSEELDPEMRVWLFKLKGKKVSARTKHIIQVVIDEELKELHHTSA